MEWNKVQNQQCLLKEEYQVHKYMNTSCKELTGSFAEKMMSDI